LSFCKNNLSCFVIEQGLPFATLTSLGLGIRLKNFLSLDKFFIRQLVWSKLSCEEGLVAGEVHKSVATVVEKDNLFLSFLFCFFGLLNDGSNGMACFGSTDSTFCLCPGHSGLIAFDLVEGTWFEEAFDDALAHERSHTVVSEAASVNGRGDECMAEGIHCEQWSHTGGVAVVISEWSSCHSWTGGWFDGDYFDISAVNFVCGKWKSESCEVASASGTTDDHIGSFLSGDFELFFGLKANNRLVEEDVIEDGAEGIFSFAGFISDGGFNCFAYCDPEAPGRIGHVFEDFSSCVCFITWACDAVSAPDLHHKFPERFLVEADSDHKDFAFEADDFTRESKSAAPLSSAGFGGESLYSELFIVPSLCNSSVWFVTSWWAVTFVLIIDSCGGVEILFEIDGAFEWCRPPAIQDI